MFKVNERDGNGFSITLENQFTVKVEWSADTETDNLNEEYNKKYLYSRNCQVTIYSPCGGIVKTDDGKDKYTYVTADKLIDILNKTKEMSVFCPNI